MSDNEIARLIEDYIIAATLAQKAGFALVDVKHCHGYLGHEFLSAVDRKGKFGGNFFKIGLVSCARSWLAFAQKRQDWRLASAFRCLISFRSSLMKTELVQARSIEDY